jgi:ABC-type glycerol-3-phosphate transport system substrate-binding protein
MKRTKTIITLLLTAGTLVLASACGGGREKAQTPASSAPTQTISQENAPQRLEPDLAEDELLVDVAVSGTDVYFLTRQDTENRLYAMQADGTGQTKLAQKTEEIFAFCPGPGGSVWYCVPQEMGSILTQTDRQGTTLVTMAWDGYINDMAVDSQGNLVILGDGLSVLDSQGTALGTISGNGGYVEQLYTDEDGTVLAEYMDMMANQRTVYAVDTQAMTLVETQEEIPSLKNTNWTEKGFADSAVYKAFTLPDGSLLVAEEIESYTNLEGLQLYLVPQDYSIQTEEKTVLTLAGYHISQGSIGQQVAAFNRESTGYYIELMDYDQYDTQDNYSAGAERLLYDITTGELPDMLVVDSSVSVSVADLARKGYLADVGSLVESGGDMDTADYFQNVLEAAQVDGTLYSVIPSFYLETLAADRAVVGDVASCDLTDALGWQAENPGRTVFSSLSPDMVLRRLLWTYQAEWMPADGTCHFTEESFLSALEFVASVPTPTYDDAYYAARDADRASGNFLFAELSIGGLGNFFDPVAYWGERTAFVGYPTPSGNGSIIQPEQELCIFADSADVSGCWEFLKSFLTLDYQQTVEAEGLGLPIRKSALTRLTEDDITLLAQAYGVSQETIENLETQAIQTIESASVLSGGASVFSILWEEAQSYIAGDKTVEQAAENIQSRVSLYLAEQG